MPLRDHIKNEITTHETEIEFQGDKFKFRALGDAGTYAKALLVDPQNLSITQRHFERLLTTMYGEDAANISLTPEIVRSIIMVHETLVPEIWDPKKKTWKADEPYDVSEILKISVENGFLFTSALVQGAMSVLGFTAEVLKGQTQNEQLQDALVGNSEVLNSDN